MTKLLKKNGSLYEVIRRMMFRLEWAASRRLRALYSANPAMLVLDQFRGKIAGGPFKGMSYIRSSAGSCLAPKVAGTYERELIGVVQSVLGIQYDVILDVGAAEGYYAVGFAMLLKHKPTRIVAFDLDPNARSLLTELALANEVIDRIELGSCCSHDVLDSFKGQRVFVVCDIEGGELELLDPDFASALLTYDILVEVHDEPGSTLILDSLRARFSGSHSITLINSEPRVSEEIANQLWLRGEEWRRKIFDEKRVRGTRWLYLKAVSSDHTVNSVNGA